MKTFQVGQQLPNTSSQTTTLQVSTGGKIHQLFLRWNDVSNVTSTITEIRAEITGNIRLSFGGIDVVNVLAARLLDIYMTLGARAGKTATLTAGGMPLNLAPLFYDDPKARDLLGMGTANVNNIQVQIGNGTIDDCGTVQVFTTREAINENLGTYGKIVDYPRNYNSAAQDTLDTLPRNLNSAYLALFINAGASGVISYSEIRVNAAPIREQVPFHTNTMMNATHGWDTAAADSAGEGAYFAHVFCDGALDQYLPMKNVADLRCLTTFTTAPGAGGYVATPITLENFLGT